MRALLTLLVAASLLATACASAPPPQQNDPLEAAHHSNDAEHDTAEADAEREAARIAAAQATASTSLSGAPIGGEATKTGADPVDSKLTDFDKLDIAAILSDQRKELTSCFDSSLAIIELPPEGFLVKARFTIEADGTVKGAEVVEATQRFPEAERCFLMKIATTTFPAPPEGRVIETTYPFTIKRKLKQN